LGGAKWTVIDGILKSIELALATHVQSLGTLNEQRLEFGRSFRFFFGRFGFGGRRGLTFFSVPLPDPSWNSLAEKEQKP
jgi:hypothetical protein